MNPRLVVYGALLVGLAGFAGYETRLAQQRAHRLAELRERGARVAQEIAQARRAHEAAARELADAERQLAALPSPARGAEAAPERRAEMHAWLAQLKKLRQLFDERPDQRIPEMELLAEQDWLRVAKTMSLGSEDERRAALAAVRDLASSRFVGKLSPALRKLVESNPSDVPPVTALAPFLAAPVDPRMLDRYELIKTTRDWRVQTKAPIDADYDGRHYVGAQWDGRGYGGGSEGAPWTWVAGLREQMDRAALVYATANKGTAAPGLVETLPFFDPPLPPTLADKLIKAEARQLRKFYGR